MRTRTDRMADLCGTALLCLLIGLLMGVALHGTKPAAVDAAVAVPAAIPGVTVDVKARRVIVDEDSPLDVEICLAGDCRLLGQWTRGKRP